MLDCPSGTFQGAGVKTVVLFFDKGSPTRKVWFYQLDPGRSLGKTNPLNDDDMAEFVKLQKSKADSPKSWSVERKDIDEETFDLSVKNPNGGDEVTLRSPGKIMDEIASLDAESAKVLAETRGGCETGLGAQDPGRGVRHQLRLHRECFEGSGRPTVSSYHRHDDWRDRFAEVPFPDKNSTR